MAANHDQDHGNTPAAWTLTLSWIIGWTVAAAAIIFFQGSVILWTLVALAISAVSAIVAGIMKKMGLGRNEPRRAPAMPDSQTSQAGTEISEPVGTSTR